MPNMMDSPWNFREECPLVAGGDCLPDNAQGYFSLTKRMADVIKKPVAAAGDNDHVSIHARSDPRNNTSNGNATDPLVDTYTMHFLTNCQWNDKNQAQYCSKPWRFENYMLGSGFMKDRSGKGSSAKHDAQKKRHSWLFSFPLKRNAAHTNKSDDAESFQVKWKKMIHNRQAFAKVHLTGCVLVGVSFLCTAVGFFILPALGQWVSVGNLALATLATIFLLTSSIYTAVLAKETVNFFDHDESAYTAEPSRTLGALV